MLVKEINGQLVFVNNIKTLRYKKAITKEIKKKDSENNEIIETVEELKNVCVFNPQPEHFLEAGYKELIQTEKPEIQPNQYIETTYEFKDDKYYEVHNIIDFEVIDSE